MKSCLLSDATWSQSVRRDLS